MKHMLFITLSLLGMLLVGCQSTKVIVSEASFRNYAYEHYCDSIWEANPDYYNDVLVETDEFQDYVEQFGDSELWYK